MKVALRFTALLAFIAFFETADAAISGWSVPVISDKTGTGAEALTVKEDKAISENIATLAATSDSSKTFTYTLLTADNTFAVSATGELTVNTALDFETTQSYKIEVKAEEADTADTGTATITITVEDVNEAPAFASTSYSVCVADGLAADTSVYAVTATDQDADNTITYSIIGGNTLGDFQNSESEIRVSTGKTLDRATTESYTLEFKAADSATPSLTGTTIVTVTVGECSTATTFAVSIVTLLLSVVTALNSF